MSEFQKSSDKLTKNNWGDAAYTLPSAVFINETLAGCKAIWNDLDLSDESLIFEIYDRLWNHYKGLDEFLVTPCDDCPQSAGKTDKTLVSDSN